MGPSATESGCAPAIPCAAPTWLSRFAIPCSTTPPGSACVADIDHPFRSALAGGGSAGGHSGRHSACPGVVVSELRAPGLAVAAARKGRRGELIAAVRSRFGVDLPATPRRVVGPKIAVIWGGPDQWLAAQDPGPKDRMEARPCPPVWFASLVDL